MGLLTIIKKQKLKDNEVRVLTLGLDNSGKTTIIKRMLGEDTNSISPTMGFQIKTLQYNNYTLNIWDIGGQTTLRAFWGNYFDKTDVVMWVIDGLSLERLQESYVELREKVILQDRLVGIYLMVVINKIDLIPQEERRELKEKVTDLLQLSQQIPQRDKWDVQLVSGKTGEGVECVLDWIISRDY
ncbi:ADP-ribosylation factor-like protein 2 [Candida viswanathii]|uniref:ADP-ribosylation factor-like protein 2 n=1 Tax=Candida viswanathii TaxID=5486 RepID=A0A367XPL1_9ASCO|nr:ADP-ribosylation factor-like protein 2 [Candida viswanathii]